MEIIGTLMVEHKLIMRMVVLVGVELAKIVDGKKADPSFIEKSIDFFHTYADEWHHGKEEDILFTALAEKELSPEHKKIMENLVTEHQIARGYVKKLAEANKQYKAGNNESVSAISQNLSLILQLYPKHIITENRHFFIPAMCYFNKEEKQQMREKCSVFDAKTAKKKYNDIVAYFEDMK